MNLETATRRKPAGPIPDDPRPVVALPNPGLPGMAIAAMAGLCAIVLFVTLDAQRRRAGSEDATIERTPVEMPAPPPPLFVPPEPVQAPPIIVTTSMSPPATMAGPRIAPIQEARVRVQPQALNPAPLPAADPATWTTAPATVATDAEPRAVASLAERALIFDAGGLEENITDPLPAPQAKNGEGPNEAQQAASVAAAAVRPTRIRNLATVVPTGSLIRATLETPIDTSRPGFARAIVSRPTRGFDGRRVLIPRGSRLIGEYGADVRMGQNRVLINWTQVLLPDGSVMRMESPAADSLGGAGVRGRVNSFFFERFFNAVLQTALTVGGSLATYSSDAPIVIGLSNTAVTNVAGQSALFGQAPQPKITIRQGTAFNIFVARDLDFSSVPARPQARPDAR